MSLGSHGRYSPPYKGGVARSAGVVAYTETLRCERPPRQRLRRRRPSFVRRGLGALSLTLFLALLAVTLHAQNRGGPPRTPKDSAPIDPSGYWVSIVSEDWRFRMLTPAKGDYPDIQPLNDAGKKIADSWDPAKDEAAGEQCKGYGAGNIMRIPSRIRLTWMNDNTLRLETDAGQQTRLFRFGRNDAARRSTRLAGIFSRAMGTRIRRSWSERFAESRDNSHASGLSPEERRSLQCKHDHDGVFRCR